MNNRVVIIGAGPAGLTAALELIRRSNIKPIILEADNCVGGISRTVNYRGNRIDIGGHRFFSKSDWVMDWWQSILPIAHNPNTDLEINYQNKKHQVNVNASTATETRENHVLLVRNRLSRIYFLKKFFDYPLKLNATTISNLGFMRMLRISISYLTARLSPIKTEKSLQDFLVNRFGNELYLTFFKSYTEKVWGVSCNEISAEWGAQRIKGLSITKALKHALNQIFVKSLHLQQKNTSTSLIEKFLYPSFGPGQMWEEVTRLVLAQGGELYYQHKVCGLKVVDNKIIAVQAKNLVSGEILELAAEQVISTMPVKELINSMGDTPPTNVKHIANNLPYRDFITVGLLVSKMKANSQASSQQTNQMPPDNWIYIQEQNVKVGRLQIFNNWSPAMVNDSETIWLGLEYFCNEGDDLWIKTDDELKQLGITELVTIGLLDQQDVLDSTVIRMPKAYPAYFGAYSKFDEIRQYTDTISNLYLIGRNGMHRYNNQDHSMLTAKCAVDNILTGVTSKENLWDINIDDDYHEEKQNHTKPNTSSLKPSLNPIKATL